MKEQEKFMKKRIEEKMAKTLEMSVKIINSKAIKYNKKRFYNLINSYYFLMKIIFYTVEC